MQFTPYTVFPSALGTRDPLGFQTLRSRLTDRFYPQFSINTTSPVCLGLFCWIVNYLGLKGIRPDALDFAARFRDLEILWGIMATRSKQGAVVNVTRYAKLPMDVTLTEAQKPFYDLYRRLHYGIYTFYGAMSRQWGLCHDDGRLTEYGEELAFVWSCRGKGRLSKFNDLADLWLDGGNPLVGCEQADFAPFAPNAFRGKDAERSLWTAIIDDYCLEHEKERPLWQQGKLTKEIVGLLEDEQRYASFFPQLQGLFADSYWLSQTFACCQSFERFSALVQFVFNWQYVTSAWHLSGQSVPNAPHAELVEAVRTEANILSKHLSAIDVSWPLCASLRDVENYSDMAHVVIAHHMENQTRKGAQIYIDHDGVQMSGRIDVEDVKALAQSLVTCTTQEELVRRLVFSYQGTWFFEKAWAWLEAAGRWS